MKASTMIASEIGHWYAQDGSPAYEVRGANGLMRPATLRDARKLALVPSVTGIIKCAAAPGLQMWLQQQVLLAAMTLPRLPDELESDWMARVMRDSKEQGKKAAERGTTIHGAIERWCVDGKVDDVYAEHCVAAVAAAQDWMGHVAWFPEKSFAHPLGFGGKVDLQSRGWVADFKTKEFGPDAKLETWDEHAMQLAAYREGLGMPQARCAIIYVSVTVPGLARLIEIDQEALAKGWTMFQGLFQYWCAKNNFWPGKVKVAA